MKTRPKLVYISTVATPQQIKFCAALQDCFDAEFWFYESAERTRGKFWVIDLGPHCKILDHVMIFHHTALEGRYLARGLTRQLERFNPDIVMLGGFSVPSNYLAYRWARKHGKKSIVFTERSRTRDGALRKRGLVWRILRWLYCDVDMVMVSAEDAVAQFRDEFGFGDKVVAGRYAADLDAYFTHPLRQAKPAYTFLFANRLTDIYNPIGALEIFATVRARHHGSRLLMNAMGELGERCRARIAELGIAGAVEFLTEIPSWDDLHKVYARSDILILPALFSNGNFTILEAMASGMGIVISDKVLGNGKMIHDGINGFNCPPTTKDFVDRIERYIRTPNLFKAHAALNRKLVEPLGTKGTAEFFWHTVHDRLGL